MSLGGGFECELVGGETEGKVEKKEASTRDFKCKARRFKLLLIVSIIFFSSGQKFNSWKITNEPCSRGRLQRGRIFIELWNVSFARKELLDVLNDDLLFNIGKSLRFNVIFESVARTRRDTQAERTKLHIKFKTFHP